MHAVDGVIRKFCQKNSSNALKMHRLITVRVLPLFNDWYLRTSSNFKLYLVQKTLINP